jgi:hypothetical protein
MPKWNRIRAIQGQGSSVCTKIRQVQSGVEKIVFLTLRERTYFTHLLRKTSQIDMPDNPSVQLSPLHTSRLCDALSVQAAVH